MTIKDLAEAQRALGGVNLNTASIANDHPGRAKAAVTALYKTSQGLSVAFDQALAVTDPSLSPQGLQEARDVGTQAVLDAVQQRVDTLRPQIDGALQGADAEADQFRPHLDLNDFVQNQRTDSAWAHTIKPQLDAGKGWDQVVPTLDHDGILAARRFAPAHEAAQRDRAHQHEVPAVLHGIESLAAQRVIDSAPEGPAKTALDAHQQTLKYWQAAAASMNALTSVTRPQDATEASIAVKRNTFAVGAQPANAAAGG